MPKNPSLSPTPPLADASHLILKTPSLSPVPSLPRYARPSRGAAHDNTVLFEFHDRVTDMFVPTTQSTSQTSFFFYPPPSLCLLQPGNTGGVPVHRVGCGNFPFQEFLLLDFLSKELPTSDPISGVRDSPPGPYVLIVTVRLKIFNFVIYKCIFRKRNSSVKTYDIQCMVKRGLQVY